MEVEQSAFQGAITAIREGVARAEMEGDVSFFADLLTEDAVILPPGSQTVEGKPACLEFIGGVFADMNAEFHREVTLSSAECQQNGDWAFDRGAFAQRLLRKEDGAHISETGKYFWLLRREADGRWKLARLVGNLDWGEDTGDETEAETGADPQAPSDGGGAAEPGAVADASP